MKDRLSLPDELKALIEKREAGERRHNDGDLRKSDFAPNDPDAEGLEERRSGRDRRQGEDK